MRPERPLVLDPALSQSLGSLRPGAGTSTKDLESALADIGAATAAGQPMDSLLSGIHRDMSAARTTTPLPPELKTLVAVRTHGGARAGSARHLDPRAAAARLARAVRQRPRRDVLDRHLSPADAGVAGRREPVRPTRPGRASAGPRSTGRRQSPSPERWNGLAAGPPVRVRPRRQRLRRDAHHRRHRQRRGRDQSRRGRASF